MSKQPVRAKPRKKGRSIPRESSIEQAQCHFWRLPQELLDMIYDFAYGTDPQRKILSKSEHERREGIRMHGAGHSYIRRAFPASKVNDFLVSKDFFLGAAKAWVTGQCPLDNRHDFIFNFFLTPGIFYEFCTRLDLRDSLNTYNLDSYKRLQEVRLTVWLGEFSALKPINFVREDELDGADFERLRITKRLKRLRGLQMLEITPQDHQIFSGWKQGQRAMWRKNVRALRDYLWPFVSAPKTESTQNSSPDEVCSLYEGSKVCYGSSKLLPLDYYHLEDVGRRRLITANSRKLGETSSRFTKKLVGPPTTFAELEQRTKLSPQEIWRLIEKSQDDKEC